MGRRGSARWSDEGRAARTGGARGGRRCRGLRASGHRGSTRGDPAKILWGLGRSEDHRRQSILVETELTGNGGRGEIRRRGRAGRGLGSGRGLGKSQGRRPGA
jgi:hypothetical protein